MKQPLEAPLQDSRLCSIYVHVYERWYSVMSFVVHAEDALEFAPRGIINSVISPVTLNSTPS